MGRTASAHGHIFDAIDSVGNINFRRRRTEKFTTEARRHREIKHRNKNKDRRQDKDGLG